LPHGKVIQEAGGQITHVYFPERSMVSLVSHTPEGESVEVGIVGFEGMVSMSVVLGVDKSSNEMLVQIPNGALRLAVLVLRDEFKRAGALHDKLLRYTQGYCGRWFPCADTRLAEVAARVGFSVLPLN
jgi:hypothetical protein